jgi:hypothetical protein
MCPKSPFCVFSVLQSSVLFFAQRTFNLAVVLIASTSVALPVACIERD